MCDTLNYELLIAKLHVYGFGKESLMPLLSYLSNRWQKTKIDTSFSSWTELLHGVPQGSVLFFFSVWVFFHKHSRIKELQGKGEDISLTAHYPSTRFTDT